MITLNAGLSRKVGEPNYGSRGATVNLQLEVESSLVNDPEALMSRIRRLFQLARQAVDEELNTNGPAAPSTGGAEPQYPGAQRGNGFRPATAAQLRAIRALANRLGVAPENVRTNRVTDLNQLSLQEASALIDELKARTNKTAGQPR